MDRRTVTAYDTSIVRDCRETIRGLIAKYQWALLSEDKLLSRVLAVIQPDELPTNLKHVIKNQFTVAMYEACQPDAAHELREQGYSELQRFLYRAAYYRWPDRAEDVVQRTLVMVQEKFERCRSPLTFLAFALGLLRWAYQQETAGSVQREVPLDNTEIAVLSDLNTHLISEELQQTLQLALQTLPAKQRDTIVLKYFRGWSDETIAEQLNISPGNVRVIRSRALQKLRQHEQLKAYWTMDEVG